VIGSKDVLLNNLCVGWGVKLYSLTRSQPHATAVINLEVDWLMAHVCLVCSFVGHCCLLSSNSDSDYGDW